MTKREMVRLLKSGKKEWNEWRDTCIDDRIDLRGVKLAGLDLQERWIGKADLSGADLSGADLTGAYLALTDFASANLHDTWLDSAELFGANFSNADLTNTDFVSVGLAASKLCNANLLWTHFSVADLGDADFAGAVLDGTRFDAVDLSQVQGLDLTIHSGPSHIDIDTIYYSGGKISEFFLREVGIPETFIQYIPSLIGAQEGIKFYSCFISYSHKDEDFAHRLFSRMRDAKLRVWYAPEEMKGGQKLHEQIETAIRIYDKLLVVLSKASLASEWVKTEIRNARRAEKASGKRKLFPVRLVDMETIQAWSEFDADSGKNLGVELREYFIPDFREWKDHDKFEVAFSRLLRDLKADSSLPPTTTSDL